MAHRGPDDQGEAFFDGGRLGLGHCRLSILDLSPAGHQPMATPDERYQIVFNGEVYNFAELRAGLEAKGVRFRSGTDTEVLLHLYAHDGPKMVEKLRGMFAFALFDTQERRLFLARDRVGIKPLYLHTDERGTLWFASEVKALLAAGAVRAALDPTGLVHLLAFGLVPAPQSLFAGVTKLEPGCTLTIEPNGQQTTHRYWDVFDGVDPARHADALNSPKAEARYLDELEAELARAVDLRLIADVPVGAFLSGGVDSSLVCALAAQRHPGALRTFSIGYEGHRQYDELEHAHEVARLLGAEHRDIWVDADSVKGAFNTFLHAQEEPASDPIWLSVYFLNTLARQHGVIVLLTGDGGDEVFGGYTKWQRYLAQYARRWQPLMGLPQPVRRAASALAGPLMRDDVTRDMLGRAARNEEFFWSGTEFKGHQLDRLLRPDVLSAVKRTPAEVIGGYRHDLRARYGNTALRFDGPDYLNWMTYVSLKTSMAENFLSRLDKMGMAASREGRVPLLDHEVIRVALSAPTGLRIKGGQGKYPLKQILSRHLPPEIVHRPKMGFQSPMGEWLRTGLGEQMTGAVEHLADSTDLFNRAELFAVLADFRAGRKLPSRAWLLINLALWTQTWLNQPAAEIAA